MLKKQHQTTEQIEQSVLHLFKYNFSYQFITSTMSHQKGRFCKDSNQPTNQLISTENIPTATDFNGNRLRYHFCGLWQLRQHKTTQEQWIIGKDIANIQPNMPDVCFCLCVCCLVSGDWGVCIVCVFELKVEVDFCWVPSGQISLR